MSLTLTTTEAAEQAGVTEAVLRQWVMRGDLEPVRRGAKPLRFRYEDVAACQRAKRSKAWETRHAQAVVAFTSFTAGDMSR